MDILPASEHVGLARRVQPATARDQPMSDAADHAAAPSPEGRSSEPGPEAPRAPRRVGRLVVAAAIVVAAGAGVAYWRHWWPFHPPAAVAGPPPPVPVTLAKVEAKPVPIWLTGLGSVQAFNTVTVRPRVDGQIVRIAYTEGQDVQQGDLLVEIDPHPFEAQLAQAQAKFAQDSATLRDAELNRTRYAQLATRGDASQQQLSTQEATVSSLTAQVQADQAAIAYAGVQLAYTRIVAPISGRTGVRLVDGGNVVHASDPGGLVVITQLQPISFVFTLPQDALAQVQAAMAASPQPLQVQAFGRDPGKPLATGKLDLVNNQVNTQTGTVDLKASFPNDDHALWPGQFVTARLQLSVRQDGLTAPASAVQRGQDGTFVFTVGPDGKAKMQPVDVALTRDGIALFDHGVQAGDTVIVSGQFKVKPGSAVKDSKTEDSKPGDAKPDGTKPEGAGK